MDAIQKVNREGLLKDDEGYEETLAGYEDAKKAFLDEKLKAFKNKKKKAKMNSMKEKLFQERYGPLSDDEVDVDFEEEDNESSFKDFRARFDRMKRKYKHVEKKKGKKNRKKRKESPGTKDKPIDLSESSENDFSCDSEPSSCHSDSDSDTTQEAGYFERKYKSKKWWVIFLFFLVGYAY